MVGVPATSMFSFTVHGTPWSGPSSTPVGDGAIGRVGGGQCLVGEEPDDRVEVGVDLVDADQVGLDDFTAGDLSRSDSARQLQRSHLPELAHHPIMAHLWNGHCSAG